MNPGADRTNRVLLTLLGLLLLAVGVAGVALGLGVFGTDRARGEVLDPTVRSYAAEQTWFWPVLAAVTVVLGILGLLWVWAQLGTDRVHRLRLETDTTHGSTTLLARPVLDAVGEEIAAYPGVHRTGARMIGHPAQPRVVVQVEVESRADLGALRRRVEDEAVAHLRQALEQDVPVRLEFEVSDERKAVR